MKQIKAEQSRARHDDQQTALVDESEERSMGSAAPYLGLIEGFYGQRYSEKERAFLYKFLQGCGYSFYIYAPKED